MLAEARERTLALVEGVDEADLNRVHDPLNSPLVWDLGHIAAFEELWLCRNQAGLEPLHPELLEVYDACETPAPHAAGCPTCAGRRRCASSTGCASARSPCWRTRTPTSSRW